MKYKISAKAIKAIRNHKTLMLTLSASNKKKDTTCVIRWLKENKDNGPLTSKSNLDIIVKETGLNIDKVLEKVKPGLSPTPSK